jgi:hypothetical protein
MALVGVWLSSLESGTYFGTRFAGGSFCFEPLDGIDNALGVSPRRISSRASATYISCASLPSRARGADTPRSRQRARRDRGGDRGRSTGPRGRRLRRGRARDRQDPPARGGPLPGRAPRPARPRRHRRRARARLQLRRRAPALRGGGRRSGPREERAARWPGGTRNRRGGRGARGRESAEPGLAVPRRPRPLLADGEPRRPRAAPPRPRRRPLGRFSVAALPRLPSRTAGGRAGERPRRRPAGRAARPGRSAGSRSRPAGNRPGSPRPFERGGDELCDSRVARLRAGPGVRLSLPRGKWRQPVPAHRAGRCPGRRRDRAACRRRCEG